MAALSVAVLLVDLSCESKISHFHPQMSIHPKMCIILWAKVYIDAGDMKYYIQYVYIPA